MPDSRSIILLGPSKTGKTTLLKRLSELIQIPEIQLDEIRWKYYEEIGYDANKAKAIRKEGGMEALASIGNPMIFTQSNQYCAIICMDILFPSVQDILFMMIQNGFSVRKLRFNHFHTYFSSYHR